MDKNRIKAAEQALVPDNPELSEAWARLQGIVKTRPDLEAAGAKVDAKLKDLREREGQSRRNFPPPSGLNNTPRDREVTQSGTITPEGAGDDAPKPKRKKLWYEDN